MYRRFKKMLKIILIIVLLLLFGIGMLVLRMTFRTSDSKIQSTFDELNIPLHIQRYSYGERTMRFVQTGDINADVAVLFIHGAPGGLAMFNTLMADDDLQSNFHLFSIDRLGYGYSDYGQSETDIEVQAASIRQLIRDHIPQSRVIVFGHSYGGPIAAVLGKIEPRVTHAILAGGAVSPAHERFEWAAWLANSLAIRWMAAVDTRVASDEKLSHAEELRKIEHHWSHYPADIIMMHGTNDWLVPYDNHAYFKDKIPPSRFIDKTLPGENHFFINKLDIIRPVLMELL